MPVWLDWNISIHLLSANKNSPVDLFKLAITGNFGLIRDFGSQTSHLTHGTSKRFILYIEITGADCNLGPTWEQKSRAQRE